MIPIAEQRREEEERGGGAKEEGENKRRTINVTKGCLPEPNVGANNNLDAKKQRNTSRLKITNAIKPIDTANQDPPA